MFLRVFVKVFLTAWLLFALAAVAYGLSGVGQMDKASARPAHDDCHERRALSC